MNYRLKEWRQKRGMTQQQLSDLSGVTRVSIARLEGTQPVNVLANTLQKLAKALDCSVEDLLG